MPVGLDGIEKILITLCPETMKVTPYECVGYNNVNLLGKPKLIEWYRPINAPQEIPGHSIDYLTLFASSNGQKTKVYIRGPDATTPTFGGLYEKRKN